MNKVATWSSIEESIQIGFFVMADACEKMLGFGERGDAATSAILGIPSESDQIPDKPTSVSDPFERIDVKGTMFAHCVARCYKLVNEIGYLDEVDFDNERADGADWLSFFLSCMPREAMDVDDYTGVFHHPEAALPTLRDAAVARLELAEFVQNFISGDYNGFGFPPKTVSFLGNVSIRTVRNVFGPKGNKPIRSSTMQYNNARSDLVWGDPLDCLEWLAGRRGFHQGRLSPEWVNEKIPEIPNLEAAAALPGIVAWLGQKTSEELAGELGWELSQIRDWTRAINVPPEKAGAIGKAAGIDPVLYSELIGRLTMK